MRKTSVRGTAVGAVILLVAALGGCGGDPDNDPETGTIAQSESETQAPETEAPSEGESEDASEAAAAPVVVESGFGVGEFGNAVAVAVIKNPSTTQGGGVNISSTAYDASGQVIGTGSGNIILRSGETGASADDLSIPEGAKIARVVVQAAFSDTEEDENPTSRITVRNVNVTATDFGSFTANGEAVSAYKSDLKDVYAAAVCRDEGGKISGGGFTFVELLPGGGTSGVSVDVTAAKKPAKCEIYATISNLSL